MKAKIHVSASKFFRVNRIVDAKESRSSLTITFEGDSVDVCNDKKCPALDALKLTKKECDISDSIFDNDHICNKCEFLVGILRSKLVYVVEHDCDFGVRKVFYLGKNLFLDPRGCIFGVDDNTFVCDNYEESCTYMENLLKWKVREEEALGKLYNE